MKLSELTVDYVVEYLRADKDDVEEVKRIKGHMESAVSMIVKTNSFESMEEADEDEFLTDVALNYIQQLYDTGTILFNKSFMWAMTMDRRF